MSEAAFFNYGTERLTVGIALEIASGKRKGILNSEITGRIKKSREAVEKIVHNKTTVYGINTGFGP